MNKSESLLRNRKPKRSSGVEKYNNLSEKNH